MNTNELIDEAISLPVDDRAKVVDTLLKSLNPVDDANTSAWLEMAQRRLAELTAGTVQPIPGEEVFADIARRFGQ